VKRCAFAVLALLVSQISSARNYTITGSRTMYDLNHALADKYHQAHPDVAFTVDDAGTGKGIESAIAGTADVAAITRRLRPEELQSLHQQISGDGFVQPLARQGIAIYVNQKNSVFELTAQEIAAIFSGNITNWKMVGGPDLPIHLYSFDNTTGRYWYLSEEVMQKKPLPANVRYTDAGSGKTDAASVKAKEEQMQSWIAVDPAGIGYGDLKRINKVKLVAIINQGRAYLPTAANLQAGLYPLVRTLAFFFRRSPSGDLLAFSRWAAEQKQLIEAHGFAPLK
jgi:phosphate transport system substrate-binding protein